MAIYDNDGTANREIGKLYDNNGSANSQIDKVYDNNGTTNSLIYQSNNGIIIGSNKDYASGWVTCGGSYAGWGSIQQSGAEMLQYSTATSWGNCAGSGNARSAALIDLTGFSTLYFTTREFWYAQYGRVGLSKTAQSGSALGNNDRLIDNGAVWKTSRFTPFTAAGTYSINVSDLSGGYYIYLGLIAVSNSSNGTAHVYYSNMYLR